MAVDTLLKTEWPRPGLSAKWRRAAVWAALGIAEGAALVWFIGRMTGNDLAAASRVGHLLLDSAVAVVGVAAFVRRYRLLSGPLRDLTRLLPKVHRGEASIQELSAIGGQIAPLAAQIQDLLRELRQDRTQLDNEIRLRIATRTSALERAIGSLRQQASRDVLTGLFNRRAFDQCVGKAIERARSSEIPLSLLMIDVDRFKQFNDALGHPAGDELLRSIGQIIRSTIRENDVAFRWGGDEFAVLAEQANANAARAAAARITSLVDALGKTFKVASPPGLSVGVACLNDLGEATPAALVAAADQALYLVKAARQHKPRACSLLGE